MCSGGDPVEKTEEQAQASLTNTLDADNSTTFAENQAIYQGLTSTLKAQIANPQGLPGGEVAALNTEATDVTAQQFQSAERGANAVAAAHGGAALPSGVAAQVSGQIASAAAGQTASEKNQIQLANAQAKQSNYWNAISGLGGVAAGEAPTSYAGAATGAANSTANLGNALLQSQQAGWSDIGGLISGIGGLATGAGAIGKGFGL